VKGRHDWSQLGAGGNPFRGPWASPYRRT